MGIQPCCFVKLVSIDSYAALVFQFLLTLEFIEALSDVEICGDRECCDKFFVGLYAGVCVFFVTSVSASVCVLFVLIEPVVHENV